eukprot:scaffold312873_cov33-Tisochrysis_lutea.AAC.1
MRRPAEDEAQHEAAEAQQDAQHAALRVEQVHRGAAPRNGKPVRSSCSLYKSPPLSHTDRDETFSLGCARSKPETGNVVYKKHLKILG